MADTDHTSATFTPLDSEGNPTGEAPVVVAGEVEVTYAEAPLADIDLGEFERSMREIGEALSGVAEVVIDRWRHVADVITQVFGPIYAVTPGGPWSGRVGEAIRCEADALAALAFAEGTVTMPGKRATAAWRRYAKSRYLEVRAHLDRAGRRRLRSVPMNRFGAT